MRKARSLGGLYKLGRRLNKYNRRWKRKNFRSMMRLTENQNSRVANLYPQK